MDKIEEMQLRLGPEADIEQVLKAIRADEEADRAFAAGLRKAIVESLRTCRAQWPW